LLSACYISGTSKTANQLHNYTMFYYRVKAKFHQAGKGKGSPYSIAKRRVPELILVLGSQPAGDMSHKPGSRLPLLSTRPAVILATFKRSATNFAAW